MAKTKKTSKELAKQYYPTYWDINRLIHLVKNDKVDFSAEDYKEITGFEYPETAQEVQHGSNTDFTRGVEIPTLRGSPQVTYGGIKMGRAGTDF